MTYDVYQEHPQYAPPIQNSGDGNIGNGVSDEGVVGTYFETRQVSGGRSSFREV